MKIDRLVAIIMILLERERVSANELAGMFEVTPAHDISRFRLNKSGWDSGFKHIRARWRGGNFKNI